MQSNTTVRHDDENNEPSKRLCMICSATFDRGTEHACPPEVRRRFEIDMWVNKVRLTYNGRTPRSAAARVQVGPQGKRAALAYARQALQSITAAQVAAIGTGEIEWAEIYSWFGFADEVKP